MTLHFKTCLSSLKPPQIIPTNAQLSQSFNKWNINHVEKKNINQKYLISNTNYDSNKLEVVKQKLRKVGENSLKGLYMIDAMQRLNIDYHFQEEIEAFLTRQYHVTIPRGLCHHYDLHETALRFRLLRQQSHFVPQELFNMFKNKEEKFNPKLGENNIKGMIELYEASQLSMVGEDILDEAEEFSMKILKEKMGQIDYDEAMFVRRTLEYPFYKNLAMFNSRNFYGNLYSTNEWLGSLKEVAKMDFSLLQGLYHHEIAQFSKWWKELGLTKELPNARNQPIKWYIWSLACLTDPNLSEERIEVTKSISLIYIIDDIFDIYGTLDELTLFTEVVSRWEIDNTYMEQLPYYMKTCFIVLYDLINEISSKIHQNHGWDPKDSLRKTEWREYLENGIISSRVHILLIHIFFLLGKGLNKQNVDTIDSIPPIISSPATILRLWDDLGNAEDENQQGNDGSYVSCLMMEQPEYYCKRRARDEVMRKICNAWKTLNQESLFDTNFHKAFTKASLNLARMVPLMYSYDDNHSLPSLEAQVHSLLYGQNLDL